MKRIFNQNKQKQSFIEDQQLSPTLDPNQAPKCDHISTLNKNDNTSYERKRFTHPIKNILSKTELNKPSINQVLSDQHLKRHTSILKKDNQQQKQNQSVELVESKQTQQSSQKVIQLASNIFNKHLVQIKSTNQDLLTNQQSQKLKEKILNHINDCISLIKVQLKYSKRTQSNMTLLPQENSQKQIDINSQNQKLIQKQILYQNQIIQENSIINTENSNQNQYCLELINFCIAAFEQLTKDQTNFSDAITHIEKLLKIIEGYDDIINLPCIQNLQLYYAQILLRCGLLKKVERCLLQVEVPAQNQLNKISQKEKQIPKNQSENIIYSRFDQKKEQKKTNLKQNQEFDVSKYYSFYCEYLREQNQIEKCVEESNNILNPHKIEAFLLKIGIFIDRNQLEQALYLIEQGKLLFQKHKQPLIFLQLMNLKLKIILKQKQYSNIHSQLAEMKEIFEQSKLRMSMEFCQSLLYESQAFLITKNITECTLVLEEATYIAKNILKDRYNQSSIIGDIYYLKASAWYQQSFSILDEEERSKLLKHAISLCQLCIKIRKNYLYSKLEKNSKVIDTLQLQLNLLVLTNQNNEYRKVSAELVEYELL